MNKMMFLALLAVFSPSIVFAQSNDVVDVVNTPRMEVQEKEVQEEKTQKDSEEEESNSGRVEKLEVTGSYIKRIDIEGPSPVVTYDSKDFDVAGTDTVSDFLKESSMFSGISDSGNRDGYFTFRGQHAGSTLVLINGMRVPKLGGPDRGFYAGVEGIPTNIIERVEVLKDGSSALYGSDAMAGVVNFITKKDYDGAEFSTRVNVPEINQGIQQNHSISFGKNYNRGNWFVTSQYVEQRGYTDADVGNYYRGPSVGQSSYGNWTTFDTPNGKQNKVDIKQSCGPGVEARDCNVDLRNLEYIREPRENIGTLASGRYDISSDTSVAFVGMYNRRKRMDLGRPQGVDLSARTIGSNINVSQLGSTDLQANSNGNQFATMYLNGIDEIGGEVVAVTQDSYSAQTKVESYFLDTWRWDLSGSYAYSIEQRDHQNGLVNLDTVAQNLYNGYSPLNFGQNNNAFSNAGVRGIEAYEANLTTARFLTTGELFEMGGPVSVAMGVEGQWESTNDAHDEVLYTNNLNNLFGPNQEGSRTVSSVFTEFVLYPIESLEVQLAGRYDKYSDFGDTVNPKISLGYRPSKKLLLRTSWGTNFNAPSVRNMMQRDVYDFEEFELEPDGEEVNVETVRYRDPNLKQETGQNYNLGAVIQANKQWSFSIDQWNFEGQDTLARVSSGIYSDLYQNMGEAQLANVGGVTFERDADGEIIRARLPFVTNMGNRTIRGLDINVNFGSPVRLFGRVLDAGWNMEHTHMLLHKTQRAEGAPIEYRRDLEWKNTMSFTLATEDHNYRLALRTLAGDTGLRNQTRTHTEYDFNYSWDIPYWSGRMSLGVKNLFNARPPVARNRDYVDFNRGFNAYAFNALGRRYYVGYSHSF